MFHTKLLTVLLVVMSLASCSKAPLLSYDEIVACAGIATVTNSNPSRMFDPKLKDIEILAEKLRRITDSILVNAEQEINKRSLAKIGDYKANVLEYAVESQKSIYSGATDYYKLALYLSTNCVASLDDTGLKLHE